MAEAWTRIAVAALALVGGATAAEARTLNLDNPADSIAAFRKIQCSTEDGAPAVYHWTGRVYARVPGEPDKHLFNVEGMNVRQCGTVTDEKLGAGARQVSRELMVYTDPATGEVLRSWENPWTGKTVDVVHVANDPVNMHAPIFPTNAKGEPYRIPLTEVGDNLFWAVEVPLFYPNPLGGDYQPYVGNMYHAMEIFDFVIDKDELLDSNVKSADAAVTWVRIAPWLPWMEMGGRPGIMVFNAVGGKVDGIEALPDVLKQEIATNYTIYDTPPPLDDARPNETSWTYFKKLKDAERAQQQK